MNLHEIQTAVHQELAQHHDTMIQFLRDLIAIPSFDSQIGPITDAIGARMADLGFDEVRRDSMGNILGRIGNGSKKLLYDSHIDTVGIGNPDEWQWDPLVGKVENGVFFARGACDEKGSTPGQLVRPFLHHPDDDQSRMAASLARSTRASVATCVAGWGGRPGHHRRSLLG